MSKIKWWDDMDNIEDEKCGDCGLFNCCCDADYIESVLKEEKEAEIAENIEENEENR